MVEKRVIPRYVVKALKLLLFIFSILYLIISILYLILYLYLYLYFTNVKYNYKYKRGGLPPHSLNTIIGESNASKTW